MAINIETLLVILAYGVLFLTAGGLLMFIRFWWSGKDIDLTSNRALIRTIGQAIKHYTMGE